MHLTVVVLTSPQRETHLQNCLRALAVQTLPASEIWVIDDGSTGGAAVVQAWRSELPLRYDWRPHDYCISRSYNRAMALIQNEYLVFISGDVLLNPAALAFYAEYYQILPPTAIWGYFGSHKPECVDSQLIPGCRVNIRDIRLWFQPGGRLSCPQDMVVYPQVYAWGGNWAISRQLFLETGGFNEAFQGWGYEDVAFANQLVQRGIPQAFAVDVWGEHQVHPGDEQAATVSRHRALVGPLIQAEQEPGLLYHPGRTRLFQLLQEDYKLALNSDGTGTDSGQ